MSLSSTPFVCAAERGVTQYFPALFLLAFLPLVPLLPHQGPFLFSTPLPLASVSTGLFGLKVLPFYLGSLTAHGRVLVILLFSL